jgi:hypothetical protein
MLVFWEKKNFEIEIKKLVLFIKIRKKIFL